MQTSEIPPSRKSIRANGQLKPPGPPPALHLFGIGPGLPYSFDGRVKDACKNEVPLPSAAKCLVVGHFLVIHHWYFIACLIQSILRKLVRFQSIRKPIRHEVGLPGGPHTKRKVKYGKEQCLLVEPSAKPRNEER
jgi:hypothetical protein